MGTLPFAISTMKHLLLLSFIIVVTNSAKLGFHSSRSLVHSNKTRNLAVNQFADCYDYTNQGGDRVHATDYVPALRQYNMDNKIESCCFTGIFILYEDENYDTINMYFNEYFIGDEEFTYNDAPILNYDNRAQSIVVTGCSAWTLYQYDSYSGYAMCVFPESTSKCTPGFYSTRQSLGSLAGQVSSVRRGCFAKDKLLPDNHGYRMRSGEHGSSGYF